MGLLIQIHRSRYDSESNAFHGHDTVTVVNVSGPFDPTNDRPGVYLDRRPSGPVLVPADWDEDRNAWGPAPRPDELVGPMCGGTFAATSDGRWRDAVGSYVAVPIHDRYERPNQYSGD